MSWGIIGKQTLGECVAMGQKSCGGQETPAEDMMPWGTLEPHGEKDAAGHTTMGINIGGNTWAVEGEEMLLICDSWSVLKHHASFRLDQLVLLFIKSPNNSQ